MSSLVIAVDGTSGSGKSSTSRGVADRLGLRYLDTGAMYRAMTWWMLEHAVDVHDASAVAARVDQPLIESGTDPLAPSISLDGEDVAEAIRSDVVNAHVSPVATVPEVRANLIALQRSVIRQALEDGVGIVVEGRDIGTAVWPDADLKLYVTADPAARAARRALEEGGTDADAVRASLETRDRIDATRGGLAVPVGATHLDTTPYSLDEVIDQVVALAERARERADA
ncbi:cytidylate kinase [Nocardioides terrae]|uniref:Cytidylate kinase n=1 Tax=Nocardioides terrae TaxID=574651 RepID=A0A1I1NNX4_9ACTN|nr:(d)CMP kinase [Nocardioides terrae]SFC99339.1 cytidylate kinase [Nocardioides terrae]